MSQPLSRLGKQLQEAIATLGKMGVRFALIGGLALAPHNVVRATQNVDLLIDADPADAVDRELGALGYQCLHRSADAANYLRGDQRIDFLYARRPAAREFLQSARELQTPFGTLHVVSAEGLIAFKLQGLVNNPRRTSNDLHPLASAGGISEPPADSRSPFEVLDDLMQVIEALCPTYPERDTFAHSSAFKL